ESSRLFSRSKLKEEAFGLPLFISATAVRWPDAMCASRHPAVLSFPDFRFPSSCQLIVKFGRLRTQKNQKNRIPAIA
ncbi:hypothetical protein, partial [Herbaspirillum sp. NPDC087042]|uniref:hypothetical protein n=1 Tax=Herbaspirillum sp. NPDC087042 TaxID=3364004 RepID=UPI00380E5569